MSTPGLEPQIQCPCAQLCQRIPTDTERKGIREHLPGWEMVYRAMLGQGQSVYNEIFYLQIL